MRDSPYISQLGAQISTDNDTRSDAIMPGAPYQTCNFIPPSISEVTQTETTDVQENVLW